MSALYFRDRESFRGATSPVWAVKPYGGATSFDDTWTGTLKAYESDKAPSHVLSATAIREASGFKLMGSFSAVQTATLKPGNTYVIVLEVTSPTFGLTGSTTLIVKGKWTVR